MAKMVSFGSEATARIRTKKGLLKLKSGGGPSCASCISGFMARVNRVTDSYPERRVIDEWGRTWGDSGFGRRLL